MANSMAKSLANPMVNLMAKSMENFHSVSVDKIGPTDGHNLLLRCAVGPSKNDVVGKRCCNVTPKICLLNESNIYRVRNRGTLDCFLFHFFASLRLSVYLFVCLSVSLFFKVFVCLSVYLCLYLYFVKKGRFGPSAFPIPVLVTLIKSWMYLCKKSLTAPKTSMSPIVNRERRRE